MNIKKETAKLNWEKQGIIFPDSAKRHKKYSGGGESIKMDIVSISLVCSSSSSSIFLLFDIYYASLCESGVECVSYPPPLLLFRASFQHPHGIITEIRKRKKGKCFSFSKGRKEGKRRQKSPLDHFLSSSFKWLFLLLLSYIIHRWIYRDSAFFLSVCVCSSHPFGQILILFSQLQVDGLLSL